MTKLIVIIKRGDGYTFGYDEVYCVEYESVEAFYSNLIDIYRESQKGDGSEYGEIEFEGLEFDTTPSETDFENSFEIFTLNEWVWQQLEYQKMSKQERMEVVLNRK